MEPRDFAYWLQGFFEVSNTKTLDEKQVEMIREHLKTVFMNITQSKLSEPFSLGSLASSVRYC